MSKRDTCKFFPKGTCTKGSKCKFLHVYSDDRTPQRGSERRSGTPKSPIKDCTFFPEGRCKKGDKCPFKHVQKLPPKAASNPRTDESKKFNRKQLILRNLHPDTTEKEVRDFVSQLADKSPSTIKFHHDNTAAMAGFQENIDIGDLRIKMVTERSLQTLHGNEIQLDEVPFCSRVLLWHIPADTSKEDIECEVRRVMELNSIDNVSYNDGDEFAIVAFKVTDLSKLCSANLVLREEKLSVHFYDENLLTSEMYDIIHGRTKTIKILVKDEILDYLMEERQSQLQEIVKTSDFRKETSEQGCFLLVRMTNWRNDAEKKIRDAFRMFVSKYDSKQIPTNPKVLGIPHGAVNNLFLLFKSKKCASGIKVQLKNYDIFVTGPVEDVDDSIGGFEEVKADYMKLLKEKLLSTTLKEYVKRILKKYPMFNKDSIKEWLKIILEKYPMFKKDSIKEWFKTDPGLGDENLMTKISTIDERYTEEDKLAFFQTETFKNCQHRILKECSIVLATQQDGEFKRKESGAELDLIIGDISTVTSDVIINSTSSTIGSGGFLAKSLQTVAGPIYANECNRRRHETIDEWDHKATTGGALRCKDVFHARLGSYNSKKLRSLLVCILEDAASMSHSSVAVPMLGTGALHYAKQDVVKDVVQSVDIYNAMFPNQSLKKVFLVIERHDRESLLAFRDHRPSNSSARVKSESVKVTFLGIRHEDLTNAVSILTRCLNEQTSNERDVFPPYWDKMPLDIYRKEVPFHLVSLPNDSEEYNKVINELMHTSGNSIRKVLTIHRVQNPQLYKSYMIRKQDMDIRNGSHQNERSLFHGTTEESSSAINHHGFNRSYAGKNAAFYGDGNYFAVNSSYSVRYARSNARGEKLMYMAKVLVGEYTQGQHGMKAPPKKGTGTDLYDSVVNNVANPSIFVVFPDNHAYPEYLICFE